ncbi:MAG: DUF368 domain-containing protein [Lachnospiraceae bacterium]|nr:DUF368 domain-containing protein [Lachnospiraceae bacterium]
MKMEWLKTVLKGLWVGSTMTVPGVSGGTMAVVVGVYEDLIHAINGLKDNLKENIGFLLRFVSGAGLGFLIFARIVTLLLEHEVAGPLTRLLFCGVVLGGIPLLVRKSCIRKIGYRHVLCLFAGAFVVFQLAMLPQGLFRNGEGLMFWIVQFIAGVIVAIALILPGISVTHILYIMGIYEMVLQKVYALELLSLLPLASGVFVGTFMTTNLLEKGLEKYPEAVYMAIIGFVAASMFSLIPRYPIRMPILGALIAAGGFVGMYMVTKKVQVRDEMRE